MSEVILYSLERHPQCEELKGALQEHGVQYREIDIHHPDAMNELRQYGCHSLEPPVIGIWCSDRIHNILRNDDLFWDGALVREAVLDLANGIH